MLNIIGTIYNFGQQLGEMKKTILIIISFYLLLSNNALYAIDTAARIDSLINLLEETPDRNKATVFNKLAEEYLDIEPETAREYASKALQFAYDYNKNGQSAYANYYLGVSNEFSRNYSEAKKYLIEALNLSKEEKIDKLTAKVLASLGSVEDEEGNREKALEYLEQSLDISKEIGYIFGVKKSLNNLGITNFFLGNYTKAINYFNQQYELAKNEKDTASIASSLNALSICYDHKGQLSEAIQYSIEALKLAEELNEPTRIAVNLLRIANIYQKQKLYDESLNYFTRALEIYEKEGDQLGMADSYNNIGILYQKIAENKIDSIKNTIESKKLSHKDYLGSIRSEYDRALEYYSRSRKIYEELKDTSRLVMSNVNIAVVLKLLEKYGEARKEFERVLVIAEELQNKKQVANILYNLAEVYRNTGAINKALDFYDRSLKMSKELGHKELVQNNYKGMADLYEEVKNYKQAYTNYKQYTEVKDLIYNEQTQRTITEMKEKYEADKKQQQIELLNKDNKLQEVKIQRQRTLNISFIIGLLLVLSFTVFAFWQLRVIKKKNNLLAERNNQIQQQKEEIETQKDEIEAQRDLVFKQKQEITDSIHYAQRIQRAVLPSDEFSEEILPEHFILFKPRDIVSGDFYWLTKKNKRVITVAADCTGHGVPGAFMSMLGVSFLNEIVNKMEDLQAHEILNQLREYVKTTLGQRGKEGEAKDGMDVALTIIDLENMNLQYAGAYNSLYIIREGELIERKADKMPIGIYIKEKESFTKHELDLQKDDTIYTFSDGYVDQFGGENGRKFMSKPFKRLLLSIQEKSMAEQKDILEKNILDWRGDIPQVDDIIVLGIRV